MRSVASTICPAAPRRRAGRDLPSRAGTRLRRSGTPRRAVPSATRPARRRARCSDAARRRSARACRTPYRCSHLRIVSWGTPVRLVSAAIFRVGVKTTPGRTVFHTRYRGNVPEGDSLHRAALRLQAIVGQRVEAESPHPRAQVGRIAERIDGKVLESVTRARQEPGAPLRGRRRRAVAPAPDRALDGAAARRAPQRQAVARAARRARRGRPLERPRARAAHARARPARPGHPRAAAADRRDARTAACVGRRRAGSARRCSTSRSSPGSGTCGWPRRSGRRGSRRGGGWRRSARTSARRALETAAELMRASVDRGRGGPQAGLPPGRAAVPALPDADPVVGAGRRQPHGVLVPDVPGRREPARRVLTYVGSHRTPASRTSSLRVAARLLPRRVRGRARRAGAVRVRGARDAGGAVALRVPPARPRLRRGAGADPATAARRAQRDRRSEARAGRRDLRARPRRDRRHGRRRALPVDPVADADVDRRALRRLRLERRGIRRRVRRPRADALRHEPDVRRARAGRRALRGHRRRPRRRHHAASRRLG